MKTTRPVLIRPHDAEPMYGVTARQIKRWVHEGKLAAVKLSGDRGPLWVRTAELDALIAATTTRVGGEDR